MITVKRINRVGKLKSIVSQQRALGGELRKE